MDCQGSILYRSISQVDGNNLKSQIHQKKVRSRIHPGIRHTTPNPELKTSSIKFKAEIESQHNSPFPTPLAIITITLKLSSPQLSVTKAPSKRPWQRAANTREFRENVGERKKKERARVCHREAIIVHNTPANLAKTILRANFYSVLSLSCLSVKWSLLVREEEEEEEEALPKESNILRKERRGRKGGR